MHVHTCIHNLFDGRYYYLIYIYIYICL